MIVAEMEYEQHYSEFHAELVDFIQTAFIHVEHGLQGDSWIWIFENDQKVAIDTFSSMKHQIKASMGEPTLVNKVLEHLGSTYKLNVYAEPELEGHE